MSTYTTSEKKIVKVLDKYTKHIKLEDYLSIKDSLKAMQRVKNLLGQELGKCNEAFQDAQIQVEAQHKMYKNMTFIDKLIFLIKR